MFECEALGIKLQSTALSQKLQKKIDLIVNPKERVIITGSHREFFEMIVQMWKNGQLVISGKNNTNRLGEYTVQNYDVRKENKPEECMNVESIRPEVYLYHTPE